MVLWLVLIAGAVITLGYPAFFGSMNVAAQTLMTATLAALVALILVPAICSTFLSLARLCCRQHRLMRHCNRCPRI
jgi:hypothetical protein